MFLPDQIGLDGRRYERAFAESMKLQLELIGTVGPDI